MMMTGRIGKTISTHYSLTSDRHADIKQAIAYFGKGLVVELYEYKKLIRRVNCFARPKEYAESVVKDWISFSLVKEERGGEMSKSEMIEDIETLIKANRDNPNCNKFWLAHMIREVIKFELEEKNDDD